MADQEEIERLLNMPEQELLRQWYDERMKAGVGASSEDLVGAIGDLRIVFINWCRQMRLADKICNQWDYRAKKEQYSTRVQLTCAMADFLVGENLTQPFLLASILAQQLADEICSDG